MMHPMNTDTWKRLLEEEKEKIESEMGHMGQKSSRVPDDWETAPEEETGGEPDLADQADIIIDRENKAAIFADLEARYDTVLAALHRIAQGVYGTCEVCGAPVEEARLTADPSATTCVAHRQ